MHAKQSVQQYHRSILAKIVANSQSEQRIEMRRVICQKCNQPVFLCGLRVVQHQNVRQRNLRGPAPSFSSLSAILVNLPGISSACTNCKLQKTNPFPHVRSLLMGRHHHRRKNLERINAAERRPHQHAHKCRWFVLEQDGRKTVHQLVSGAPVFLRYCDELIYQFFVPALVDEINGNGFVVPFALSKKYAFLSPPVGQQQIRHRALDVQSPAGPKELTQVTFRDFGLLWVRHRIQPMQRDLNGPHTDHCGLSLVLIVLWDGCWVPLGFSTIRPQAAKFQL
mmetsp:Transcript_6515/g.16061  ORF Transcript_6515/g.16061 Transcript_6515/m.16061 type:complete len:280 (+) Transcript_6515:869-1708(+)